MIKKELIVIAITISVAIFLGVFSIFKLNTNQNKIVYINNVKIFNGFSMSIDMGKKYKTEIKNSQKSFDSLLNVYKIVKENSKQKEKIASLEEQLRLKDLNIKEQERYLTNDVSQQVWDRLNVYIKDFGEKNNYQFIIGTQGNGNIMYADEEKLDVTSKLLEFANLKYEGQ